MRFISGKSKGKMFNSCKNSCYLHFSFKMSDNDSGLESHDENQDENERHHRIRRVRCATTYREQIVICVNCRQDIFPWSTRMRIDGQLVWYPVDVTTLRYDAQEINWRCRRCHVVLSGAANAMQITNALASGQCILSFGPTVLVFADFRIIH